ncbi:MAG: hypothetical protein NC418_00035 [Muribaculaceae bacterium]|nr:hypothetical protein [Muribaculaceae bacterium]
MSYEDFVVYSCLAIVVAITIAFLRWMERDAREARRRREAFERIGKAIENSIKGQREVPCDDVPDTNEDRSTFYLQQVRIVPVRSAKPKPRRVRKPKWWRFLTEETLGTIMERRRRKEAEAKARENDPWTSRPHKR